MLTGLNQAEEVALWAAVLNTTIGEVSSSGGRSVLFCRVVLSASVGQSCVNNLSGVVLGVLNTTV